MAKAEDKILNPRPHKHYRRTYSVQESNIGIAIVLGLVAVGGWVAYRGQHPDPTLFGSAPELNQAVATEASKGALPKLAASGFKQGPVASFNPETLYKKINGRADYFKSRGFVSLTFTTLTAESNKANVVDVEFYDMGAPENAQSAFDGERSSGSEVNAYASGGGWRLDQNALYLARGKYYVRLIGASTSDAVLSQLTYARKQLEVALGEGQRPWTFAILVDELGIKAGALRVEKENAFSFEFANNVTIAPLATQGKTEDTEVFLTRAESPKAAEQLASKFIDGFASLGKVVKQSGVSLVEDRYLQTFSGALHDQRIVYGVRGAPDPKRALEVLELLGRAVTAAASPEKERAPLPASGAPSKDDSPSPKSSTEVPYDEGAL